MHQNSHNVIIPRPHLGYDNQPFNVRPTPHAPHITMINQTINDIAIINQVNIIQSQSWAVNDYHWYHNSGVNYCHYYDSYYHWYGFYADGSLFWARYYDNRFWWYDPYWHRWDYYYGGNWWWQNPANVSVIYIYVNNSYYNYGETSGGMILQPVYEPAPYTPAPDYEPAPADTPPAVSTAAYEMLYYSDDGTRMAQVYGDRKTAALYNPTEEDTDGGPKYLNYLGVGVTEVRYKNDESGKVLNILVLWETEDGTKDFSVLDSNGNALNQNAPQPEPQAENAGASAPEQIIHVDTQNLDRVFDNSR